MFQTFVNEKDTQTLGELLTLGSIVAPSAEFTGPVDVVLGQNDLVFCGGDCEAPVDQTLPVIAVFYPRASASSHFIAQGAGHVINGHYSASSSWQHQLQFLSQNGF